MIPWEYDQWHQLQRLDVHSNHIHGSIPPSFCNWTAHINIFSVFDNEMQGVVPACLLRGQAQLLLLHENRFTGTLPYVGAHVQTLSTSSNRFEGSLPDLGQATALQTCTLHANRFTGSLAALNLTAPSYAVRDIWAHAGLSSVSQNVTFDVQPWDSSFWMLEPKA